LSDETPAVLPVRYGVSDLDGTESQIGFVYGCRFGGGSFGMDVYLSSWVYGGKRE
jgi:hypothetical protein